MDPFPSKDMQTLLLRFAPIFMKDTHSTEYKVKSIFIFRVIMKIHRKLSVLNTKITITRKIKT